MLKKTNPGNTASDARYTVHEHSEVQERRGSSVRVGGGFFEISIFWPTRIPQHNIEGTLECATGRKNIAEKMLDRFLWRHYAVIKL